MSAWMISAPPPEIDIAALRDLSELQVPAQGQAQPQQFQQPKQPSKLKREFARSSKLALTVAAVVPSSKSWCCLGPTRV